MAERRVLRRRLAALAQDAASRVDGRHRIALDAAPSARSGARWGHGRPEHARLRAVLGAHAPAYRESLHAIASYREDLLRIARGPGSTGGEPYWLSAWMPGLDAAALYAFLRQRDPARFVEIGSGVSTRFARRAVRDGGLRTRITSVDPAPREPIDALCDEVVREPLETVEVSRLTDLEAGDVVFADCSHRVFSNSDAVAFSLDVLPALPPGVLVGIHDVFLPSDYPPDWSGWWFSEQYVLAAYLLAGAPFLRPVLAAYYASGEPELVGLLDALWDEPRLAGVERRGWALWLETV